MMQGWAQRDEGGGAVGGGPMPLLLLIVFLYDIAKRPLFNIIFKTHVLAPTPEVHRVNRTKLNYPKKRAPNETNQRMKLV